MSNSFSLTNRNNRLYFLYKVFLFDFNNEEALKELHENYFEYNFSIKEEKTIKLLIENLNEYIKIVKKTLTNNWDFERINFLERSVLVNGIFEITTAKNKKAIVINESINYVKEFCELDSPSMINGILDNIKN